MNCRHCSSPLELSFVDLGFAPPSNAYLSKAELSHSETYYPLRVKVCDQCWLVQTEDYAGAEELFNKDYAYFSSISSTWLAHARAYALMITDKLSLNSESFVIEVASNDGYLLRNFINAEIPCLGVEPTVSTAIAAEEQGIPVLREFFSFSVAKSVVDNHGKADLVIANNVYAHVPDINDFTRGLASLLKPDGVVTLEFPHLLKLIRNCQFDTIYHEHYSYLSLEVVSRIFAQCGLKVWDVETLESHGGSLRVYGCHLNANYHVSERVSRILRAEAESQLTNPETYSNFQSRVIRCAASVSEFLLKENSVGTAVGGYGAAAKASTLLNFCGIKPWLIPYICDASSSKQGMFLPGSHIPVIAPQTLIENPPDVVVVFPWNILDEIHNWIKTNVGKQVRIMTLQSLWDTL